MRQHKFTSGKQSNQENCMTGLKSNQFRWKQKDRDPRTKSPAKEAMALRTKG